VNAGGTTGRHLISLAVAALLAGCAAAASPTPAPATPASAGLPSAAVATPTPTTTATTAPSPTPAAVSYGPVTVVTGTNTCPGLNPDWTQDPGGTWRVRDLTVNCTDKTDDPRVSGTQTATWGMDVWGALDRGIGTGVQWGTVHLENTGGAWEGRLAGVASQPGRGDIITIWYRGTGGYAGLAYFELITGSPPTWKIQGQVFPGDPPPPYAEGGTTIVRPEASGPVADNAAAVVTGTADCSGLDFAWTADPDGTWHVRDDYHADRCTLTTDDPRVTGVRSSTWNFDLWGNPKAGTGAGVQWGTPRLENDGGAWEGRATGVVSLPGSGDIIVNWYEGTGGYRRLAYFELWTGSGPWQIQGQVFPGDPPTP
jgi:hypothetical protein